MISLKTRISRLLLLAAWAAGMSMSSCSSDPEVEAADSVEVRNLQDEICFAYDSEEPMAFSIVSNKTWSIAKSNLDWLEVSQMNGGSKYPSTVLLTPSVNDDLERSGILTVYAGATTRRVTIVQEAFPIVPEITLRSGLPDDKTLWFSYTVSWKLLQADPCGGADCRRRDIADAVPENPAGAFHPRYRG